MAESNVNIMLDTVRRNRISVIYAVENDYGARFITAAIMTDGKKKAVKKTAVVTINAERPDGQRKAFEGSVNEDGTVKVPVTQWMLEFEGEVVCSVSIVTSTSRLTTTHFYIQAQYSVWDGTSAPSADDPNKDVIVSIIAAENERVANENARISAETERVNNEKTRVDNENIRIENEGTRQALHEEMKTFFGGVENVLTNKNVAQELGDSEEMVLSQKAATREVKAEEARAIERENEIEALFVLPTQEAVDKWLDEHPEATTTVQDGSLTEAKFTDDLKLHAIKDYVTPQMFGAKADGMTDDKNAIQNAINALKDGGLLFFPESNTPYKVSGNISIIGKSHITIMNANLNCNDTESCFNIQNSSDVTFENCVFMGGIQTIRLFTCDTIKVNNCTFKECGYCIIQQMGYASNNVFITGNMCLNGKQDFVEANCETNAPSYNWIIDGNIYCHDEIPTESKTEYRFVGFTRVENITITNNIVNNVKGDGAVHLENVGGNVIVDGNTFKNCLGYGYVYTMNSEKNVVISNNIFEHEITDKSTPFVYIYNSQTPVKADINIVGNQFIGNGVVSYPIHYYTDNLNLNLIITDNRFNGITTFFIGSEKSFTFTNNVVECVDFIKQEQDYKGRCMIEASISNNEITGNITLMFDGNASAFNRDLLFASNKIRGNFVITDSKNTLVSGNFFYNGFTIATGGYYQENVVLVNNFISGVGMSDANNYPVIPTAEA